MTNQTPGPPASPETRVCEIENHDLPTMLRMVFGEIHDEMN
jgi:hypothetical protein